MLELSLFTGGGGGLLGTKLLGWKCVGYVEIDEYCQRVIAQRIEDGFLDEAPIFTDIRAFIAEGYAEAYTDLVDVVTAGFPCQPFSVAGKRKGESDERNLWPETIEVIRRVRPRFCLLENVAGLLANPYFGTILGQLAESGYDTRYRVLSAAEVGAPHLRNRLWIVADDYSKGLPEQLGQEAEFIGGAGLDRVSVPIDWGVWNPSEAFIRRGVHGVAHRVDRLKAIGNGQVPAVVQTAWGILTDTQKQRGGDDT